MLTHRFLNVEPIDCGVRIADCGLAEHTAASFHQWEFNRKQMTSNRPDKFSPQSAIRNPRFAIWVGFVTMLIVSWRRWTSPIADSGREMDLPLRLLNGEWLYRDVHHIYPPLAPYFNALLYRIFGVHLDVLHAAGIACSAILVFLSYRIARRLLSPIESVIAVAAVIVFCIFKPAGNLIQPYSFAALYACVCSLAVLLLTLRYMENRRKRELIFAGILIGLAAITKQEFALAAAVTITAALFVEWLLVRNSQLPTPNSLFARLLLVVAPAALIVLPVYGWLFIKFGWQMLVEDCHLFYTHLPPSLVLYNAQRTGLDRPWLSLVQMLGAAAVAVAALSFVVMLGDRRRTILKWSATALVSSFAIIFCIKQIVGNQWDGSPLRALPVLLLAIIGGELWRMRQKETEMGRHSDGEKEIRNPVLLIIAIYSFAILARVALRVPSGGAFGGFFLPTSLILFCYLFWQILPGAMERWTADIVSAQRVLLLGHALLLVTILAGAVTFGVRYRKNFNVEIRAERGHLFAPKVTGNEIRDAMEFLHNSTQPNEIIAVLPEGNDLAFLTERRISLRHQILIPGLMRDEDELKAIERLQQERVRYVLIVNRPMREFGHEAFGRDFYVQLGQWIETNYRLVKVFGSTKNDNPQIGEAGFFIKVFERQE
ncbi:MAG: glycosyltransferase family 39 protein [Acidobacteria bacterium]|nr:glycosyltransferase family 39 protein [Acidobacteriota bacterium]